MTTYRCISDRYTQSADVFESIAEFEAMCRAAFGEVPALTRRSNGEWHDDQGAVLEEINEPAAATLGRKGGKATTKAKSAAARANGKRGGRPKKSA